MLLITLLLIIFLIIDNNFYKTLALILALFIALYKLNKTNQINNIEKFDVDIDIEKYINNSNFKDVINKCCNKEELKLLKKKINCVLSSKDTYSVLMNNVSNILPSKNSILDTMLNIL